MIVIMYWGLVANYSSPGYDLDEPILTVHQTISDVRGSFYQEKTVFLRCTVNSNPPARFIWRRGSETLSHSQDNGVDIYEPLYTQGETKVLKLKNLRPQDYASYTCQVSVRNVCGIPDKSITFELTNTTAPPALKLSVNETLVVNPGDNVTIQCSLTGGDPLPQVFWSHSPSPLPRHSLVKGGNLTIWGISVEDSGYYNCTAINNVGNPAKKTVNLLVRSMKNATFQITPDVIKESETIQLGQDLKLSCHVDAVPQEKVSYSWFKNGKLAKLSDRLVVIRNDPELPPVTSSLEIIDLRFTDYGTYLCVASFQGAPIPDLSVEVNISSETVPPIIMVPKGQSTITVREGSRAELQCEVRGKPKPPIIWSRIDKETPMPSGAMTVETSDGKLHLEKVTREMSGTYKCQTARYNGFNIRPREALVQLNVQCEYSLKSSLAFAAVEVCISALVMLETKMHSFGSSTSDWTEFFFSLGTWQNNAHIHVQSKIPPMVEPVSQDIRQAVGRSVTLRCTMLKGSPMKVATAVWRFNGSLLTVPPTEQQDYSEYKVDSLSRETSGNYECSISNDVGVATCLFQVSAKAYHPEFYYDTPNPTRKQSKNYSYVLQWTQKEPDAVDPILSYRLDVRQLNHKDLPPKSISVRKMEKGMLQEHLLTDLKVPQSYEVRLTPITRFGTGDTATRIIHYIEPISYPNPVGNTCHFEDEKICGYTQDTSDNFDWTRQSSLTHDPKRSANTGPTMDFSGTPEGNYMFIEASAPRVKDDKARLISPMYNMTARFCISFYYHMYGKHIGSLNLLVHVKNKQPTQALSLKGDRGNTWQQAHVPINPAGPFQIIFEGVRGTGSEGDIAIDDVTLKKGDCPRKPVVPNKAVVLPGNDATTQHKSSICGPLLFFLYVLLR
ncbi:MAM domain-containing glycosylphosphatidylinositol anchor protein 1 [Varanus komodoensis]|nr:MAM domain-containing glycosylphosphatidylinositol anchor protein 1 [Varanus komodoensis]